MNAEPAPNLSDPPVALSGADGAMIHAALARINDPVLTYFLAMALDRAAQLMNTRRWPGAQHSGSMAEVIAGEPHGISYLSPPPNRRRP